jgi:plasmid segregation protein ParM
VRAANIQKNGGNYQMLGRKEKRNAKLFVPSMSSELPPLVSIDHGNSYIKTLHFGFVAGYTKFQTEPPMAKDVIKYKDSYYALTYNRLAYQFDKTLKDDFYILTLFAVAKEIIKNNEYKPFLEIEIAAGLPPKHYGKLKQRFADYLVQKEEIVEFNYNGMPFRIMVTKAYIFPQAYAGVISRMEEIRKIGRLYIVDIGGYTFDTLLLKYGEIDMDHCFSFEMGAIKMYNTVKDRFSSYYGSGIEESHIDDVLLHRPSSVPAQAQRMIRETADDYCSVAVDKLGEHEIEFLLDPVNFIGGASRVMKQSILSTNKVVEEQTKFYTDPKINVRGYDVIARSMREKARRA